MNHSLLHESALSAAQCLNIRKLIVIYRNTISLNLDEQGDCEGNMDGLFLLLASWSMERDMFSVKTTLSSCSCTGLQLSPASASGKSLLVSYSYCHNTYSHALPNGGNVFWKLDPQMILAF